MKANRAMREDARRFGNDERGVSEAIGYIITFGISTIVLVTSLQAFMVIQGHTSSIAVDRAVEEVATHVAFAMEEALRAGSKYPEATFSMTISVPPDVNGVVYRVQLYREEVWVTSVDAQEVIVNSERVESQGASKAEFVQRAGVSVLCDNPSTVILGGTCDVHSRERSITIVYKDPGDGKGPGVYIDRPKGVDT